jgi:flavin reductase (DIM6/NTAB) family NADH-FMN oxidoreductase RutF
MELARVGDALKKKYPEWIDLVVSRASDGQVNVMPVGWSMIASGSPHLYAVAINVRHYTTELIQASGEFVVAAPSVDMADATHYCGTHSGRAADKIGPSGLELVPATEIETPLLKGAVYNLECVLHSQVPSGDHVIFIGEVVAAHVDPGAGQRLMNFGDLWACAQVAPGTEYRL